MTSSRVVSLLLICLTTASCEDSGPDSVVVWRQRVPGSSVVIYHVDATYNNTVSGSYDSGFALADSTEPFRYGDLGELTPYAAITEVSEGLVEYVSWTEFPAGLRNDTVTTRFIRPLPSEWTEVGDVRVENVRYRGRVGGVPCRLHEYEFVRFDETADSLVVYDLTRRDSVVSERRAFPKGDVRATLDDSGFVDRLEVEEFVTGVHPGYRTPQPFDLVDLPTACVASYWLDHTGPDRQPISDDGVFKPFWSCLGEDDC